MEVNHALFFSVAKNSEKTGSHQLRFEVTPRDTDTCVRGNLRIMSAFTNDFETSPNHPFVLGKQCQCEFLRGHAGFALVQSERRMTEDKTLTEAETILVIPEGQYSIPQCRVEKAEDRHEATRDTTCEAAEEGCALCNQFTPQLEKKLVDEDTYLLKVYT